ncbi:uncharacterized protein BYT42DRAFT_564292 [Radiomyces spectabilis]|uniref:uncharacterized protein n=1 Tax=Radiomyces spectabilis TaxID=64574 RepID=UPI00221E5ADA|nr:uncharacterized protein BYT42DRAFT_564292 [Radiomyces spectabilis]KAI8384985.1 hypothetical protein BYT42DRAFT_564292 [Radiomyces spectabilis]
MSYYTGGVPFMGGAEVRPMQQGVLPQRPPPARPPMPSTQPTAIPFTDFQLKSSADHGRHHVMDFRTSKKIDLKTFSRPVRLQRKDANYVPLRERGTETDTVESPSEVRGPKTSADTSLIAPMGGATRNKNMLFKKRTRQIFLAKDDVRELKEQEQKPWILEDYDGQNCFMGTLEGAQRSDYVLFVLTDNDFKVVPVDRWYKFQQKRNFKTLTLEEAEKQLNTHQKRVGQRWMMLKREKEAEDEKEEKNTGKKSTRFKIVDDDEKFETDEDDTSHRRRSQHDSDLDDLDYDDDFQDDEEGGAEHEIEDEEIKDSKARIKRETKDYMSDEQEDDDVQLRVTGGSKLSSEGKQMRRLVRDLEKNRAYESDEEEGDPYASSAEDIGTDFDDEDQEQQDIDKLAESPTKRKTPTTPPKSNVIARMRKEAKSKPIGRPGSPSLQLKRESSPPHSRSNLRAETGLLTKERRSDEPSSPEKRNRPASSPGSPESGEQDPITEAEVINALRGRSMTTKEFLIGFKRRIKRNDRNREIIMKILKKVARHNASHDPKTRTLELKSEYQ